MSNKNRHFHSIIVHSVVAFTVIAAVSLFCLRSSIEFFNMGPIEWHLLLVFSLLIVFFATIPSTFSGVFEINKMYAKWHYTHKVKLFLSIVLFVCSFLELLTIIHNNFLTDMFIYFVNNIIVFLLSYYGLKITLGRQALAKTSYVPEFFNKEKPVDILEEAKEYIKEKPKRVDFFDFGEE